MYEVILLDADGTLFDYDQAEAVALKKSLMHIGVSGDLDVIRERYRLINASLWRELEEGKITKDKLRYDRFSRLFHEFNMTYSAESFSEYYLARLGEGHYLLEGAEDLCKKLKENYRLVILTNGMKEVQLSRLDRSSIKEYIEHIVISEEVGVSKPNPIIFEHTLDKINHRDKRTVLMVGDSLTSDIQGGLNVGIDTCWFNPSGSMNETGIEPKYQISQLHELLSILEG